MMYTKNWDSYPVERRLSLIHIWIREQIKRQREAEDAVLEQMIEEQRVIDGLNSDINENLDRTRESRKFNQEFQEKINTQIYEMNGITEDKLKGMREYKNAYYQGCAFSLFLLSVVMIGICGVPVSYTHLHRTAPDSGL